MNLYTPYGKRKKGSYYNLNNIADYHKKRIACFDCGTNTLLERDYIRPLWLGGKDELENLHILCKVCHEQKTKLETDRKRLDAYMKDHFQAYKKVRE